MYVVTVAENRARSGCLVGFTSQCSIDPPRFAVWISEQNHTHGPALEAEHLAVHLLRADDRGLAELFGEETGDEVDKFARCDWHEGPHGSIVLDGCDWFLGRVLTTVPGGDHTGFVLQPVAGEHRGGGAPLGFQSLRDLSPGHDA
jgi:flavin reductase (DIM6/NTAB) family NADH-FMN oxidoreductase RutF